MGRLVLVVVVVAALATPAGLAAHLPRWTAKGAITKLTKRSIIVNGKSCQISTGSPKLGLHVFVVGSTVKIVCADGSLLTIDLVRPGTVTSSSSQGTSGQSVTVSTSSVSSSSGSSSASASALALAGDFSVTALGNGSITVQGGKSTYSCKIGTGSPDVGAFHVGGHVSKMTCKDDVLTMIAA